LKVERCVSYYINNKFSMSQNKGCKDDQYFYDLQGLLYLM
jgi:hypothetical protein